jgi:hypothetical protein
MSFFRALEQETEQIITGSIVVTAGDFVVYLVNEDAATIGRGLNAAAFSLPFAVGRVVTASHVSTKRRLLSDRNDDDEEVADSEEEDDDYEEQETIHIEVYYQPEGDPNKRWTIWIQEGSGQRRWILQIPKKSILCVNPDFQNSKSDKYNRTLSAKGCKTLAQIPKFPWAYVPGHGLVRYESAKEIYSKKLEAIVNPNSIEGKRMSRRIESAIRQLDRAIKAKERALDRAEKVSCPETVRLETRTIPTPHAGSSSKRNKR